MKKAPLGLNEYRSSCGYYAHRLREATNTNFYSSLRRFILYYLLTKQLIAVWKISFPDRVKILIINQPSTDKRPKKI